MASAAIAKLRELKKTDEPFFLAVGFIKPHTPFIAPKKCWDLYDPSALPPIANPELPDGAPAIARHGSGEIRRYTDQPTRGAFTGENSRNLRHAYYACVSFIDAQLGRVLDELERVELEDETIVVVWGDHGYHLGEQDMWGKVSCFENAARVPLIVRAPGSKRPRTSKARASFRSSPIPRAPGRALP
ncbi:MAG: sulfatase-like hydrolase/transferase [bacterium]|nr:sulfatase-like hydrolase/transferase [bacterium]